MDSSDLNSGQPWGGVRYVRPPGYASLISTPVLSSLITLPGGSRKGSGSSNSMRFSCGGWDAFSESTRMGDFGTGRRKGMLLMSSSCAMKQIIVNFYHILLFSWSICTVFILNNKYPVVYINFWFGFRLSNRKKNTTSLMNNNSLASVTPTRYIKKYHAYDSLGVQTKTHKNKRYKTYTFPSFAGQGGMRFFSSCHSRSITYLGLVQGNLLPT